MTQANVIVDYATPRMAKGSSIPGVALVCVIAVAAAFLGAGRFADEVGFPPVVEINRDAGAVMLRILSGILVGLFSLILGLFLARQAGVTARSLQRHGGQLTTGVSITLLVCGTACLIASLLVPLYFLRSGGTVEMRVGANGAMESVSNPGPLLADLLAVLVFIAGATLAGIGVWGSLRPASEPVHLATARPEAA